MMSWQGGFTACHKEEQVLIIRSPETRLGLLHLNRRGCRRFRRPAAHERADDRTGWAGAGRMWSLIFPRSQGAMRMNKTLLTIVLGCAVAASAQQPAQPAAPQQTSPAGQPKQAQPAAPQQTSPAVQQAQPAAPQQKKEIKDPAEYNAYVGAVQQADPAAKISGLEAFLTQYPNSVMKEDALEILMGTYQQKGDSDKVIDTANRLLAVNPDSTRALVLLAYNERAAQKWPDAKQHAERGLTALGKMV